jgi:predicted DNA-binding WGR domain protein
MHRRFEFVGGSSAKFWEVSVSGGEVTVCYGRIGTVGQTLTKVFPDNTKAQQHADKLASQKLAKGYVECAVH